MIITTSFSFSSVVFSNQWFSNYSSTVDIGYVKLLSDCFCGNRVFKMNTEFYCHFCCSGSMIFRHNPLQCTVTHSLSFGFWQLFLLSDDAFPSFVYAVITLETAAVDTHNKVAVLVTDIPVKHAPTVLFKNLRSLPFCSTIIRTVIKHNM